MGMDLLEHSAKTLVLAPAGIAVPKGGLCGSADEARAAFGVIGPCVIKAQVPTGKRGKSGGIKLAATADEARDIAEAMLRMSIQGHSVAYILVEEKAEIVKEYYAAILPD